MSNYDFDWDIIPRMAEQGRHKRRITEEQAAENRKKYQHDYYMRVTKDKRRKQRGIRFTNMDP